MVDELFDRQYRAGRTELNSALLGLTRSLAEAVVIPFRVLNRIEYSAPWAASTRRARSR